MHIALVGNCQVDVLGRLLGAPNPGRGLKIEVVEIWRYKAETFDLLAERVLQADVVITQDLSEAYKRLSTASLKASAKSLVVIQNIYFRGYFPDCAYVGPMGRRLKSPVGDYHSQLIYDTWREGLAWPHALERLQQFSQKVVEEVFKLSAQELQEREKKCDVPIADQLLEPPRDFARMYTFNHPTLALHRIYLQRILRYLGLPAKLIECDDPLDQHTKWPIYDSVRQVLKLPAGTGESQFVASRSLGDKTLNMMQMCMESYEIYKGAAHA